MDLSNRIKATSIESRNYAKIIKQMCYQRLNNPKIKFRFKHEKFEFYEETLLKSSPNNSINSNYSFDLNNDFNIIPYDLDTPENEKLLIEDDTFVKEIRFFKVDDCMDTVTLSSNFLSKENWVKDKIMSFSNGNAFSSNTK